MKRFFRQRMRPRSGAPLFAALLAALALWCLSPVPQVVAESNARVVILGFDGVDPRLVEKWMQEGILPNLSKLRGEGIYSPLGTTNPPQETVLWSSFATGKDPGQTGMVDSLHRDPQTCLPEPAMLKEGKKDFLFGKNNPIVFSFFITVVLSLVFILARRLLKMRDNLSLALIMCALVFVGFTAFDQIRALLPGEVPTVHNKRKGKTLWELTADNGLRTRIIRVPATFPAPNVGDGSALSGFGTPDVRGTPGASTLYAEGLVEEKNEGGGGRTVELSFLDGKAESVIRGPRNKLFAEPEELLLPLQLIKAGAEALTVQVSGKRQTLKTGEWSEWFVLDFEFNPMITLKGMARFRLLEIAPRVKLYLSPIHLHPEFSPLNISYPKEFGKDLFTQFGFFKTLGWMEDTGALNEGRLDEAAFLEDVYSGVKKFEEILDAFLDDKSTQLYIQVFDFTDRVSHMFWRLEEKGHPAHDAATGHGGAIRDAYVRMDEIVGKAMRKMDEKTVFLVLSGHGFAPYEKSLSLNAWLVKNGFMALAEKGNEKTGALVEWTKTRAYAVGDGAIYINLAGREKQGIVAPGGEYEETRAELIEKLMAFADGETGERPVFKVYKREEMYSTFDPALAPDLRAATRRGYQAMRETTLEEGLPEILSVPSGKWSGDHSSLDPSFVKGILFSNRKGELRDPHIMDIFPTVCKILNLTPPSDIQGKALELIYP